MAIELLKQQSDDDNPNLWYFKIGGQAADNVYRVANLTQETASPAAWLAAHPVEAQAAIDAGHYYAELNERLDLRELGQLISGEVDWLRVVNQTIDSMTAGEVRDVVKRMAQENKQMLLAFRYLVRKLAQ